MSSIKKENSKAHRLRGFTIVELLIVIVVIAILAAISIVTYNDVQTRARDTARSDTAAKIMRALESYKAIKGVYPPTNASPSPPCQNGYSCSLATNGTWLKGLADEGFMNNSLQDPINDVDHQFVYIRPSAGQYSCDPSFGGFYVLQILGYENTANVPKSTYSADRRCPTAPWTSFPGASRATYYGWEN